jgi:hypothetical protein
MLFILFRTWRWAYLPATAPKPAKKKSYGIGNAIGGLLEIGILLYCVARTSIHSLIGGILIILILKGTKLDPFPANKDEEDNK